MFTNKFLKDTAERAVSTGAQFALGVMLLDGFSVIEGADLKSVGAAALTGFVLTVFKCLAARGVGDPNSASLNK